MYHAAIARVGWGGLVTLFPFLTPIVRPISQRFPDPAAYRVSLLLCFRSCSCCLSSCSMLSLQWAEFTAGCLCRRRRPGRSCAAW